MVCIYCGGKTQVVNSRATAKKHVTWRRRQCLECNNIITTHEQVDLSDALRVQKTHGRLEPFQRDKMFLSVFHSLSHRKTALKDAMALTETIIFKLLSRRGTTVIDTSIIASIALPIIKRFDKAAAVYYKAHYF